MPEKRNKAPNPADVLFNNLFSQCPPDESFKLVAEGLSASHHNAERLLCDVQFLVEAGRLSSARFLLTTAREEIAKSYILADMCRLDLEKHHSVLRRLCRAFYDHISKHAYLEVLQIPNINSMCKAKTLWESEVKRWWPAGPPEDGEPDMPHDTYFDRELPLYIDYGNYDHCWLVPTDSDQNAYFIEMFGKTPISKTEKLIVPWQKADAIGICSAEVLSILNVVFKKNYVHKDNTWEQLIRLYKQTAKRVMAEVGIPCEEFMASPFVQWPLYALV